VIVGFVPGRQGFRRLLVAAAQEGPLRYVASIHSGFTSTVRAQLSALLTARVRARPVVSCPTKAVWIEPELYCQVRWNGPLRVVCAGPASTACWLFPIRALRTILQCSRGPWGRGRAETHRARLATIRFRHSRFHEGRVLTPSPFLSVPEAPV